MRRVLAAVLIVVASVLAPFAVGANWAQRTITDSQRFAETLQPLADSPEVHQVVQSALSEAVIDAVDAEARLDRLLPQAAAKAVAAGVNSAIQSGIEEYVQGDRFGQLWVTLSGAIQVQLMDLIERDDTGAVRLEEGRIVLDTAVAADIIKAELAERGVPYVDQIEAGLIQGDIVLAESPSLQIALDALRIFLPVAAWLWIVVLGLLVLGILLWRPRARGMMWAGLGLLLGGLTTWIALNVGSAVLVDQAGTPNLAALMSEAVEVVVRFLVNALLVMVTLGACLILAGWLAGGTRSGKGIRDAIAASAHRWGTPLAAGPVGHYAARRPMLVPTLRAIVLVAAGAWLLTREVLTPASVLWTVAATAAALLAVEVVEGAGLQRDAHMAGAVAAD